VVGERVMIVCTVVCTALGAAVLAYIALLAWLKVFNEIVFMLRFQRALKVTMLALYGPRRRDVCARCMTHECDRRAEAPETQRPEGARE
jgi:hypothetical protein